MPNLFEVYVVSKDTLTVSKSFTDYFGVEKDGKILISSQLIDKTSQSYAENVVKKQVNINGKQVKYFEWHLEHRFRK